MFYSVGWVGTFINAERARERICAALDAIDAAHVVLCQTPSNVVGNAFRIDLAERLEVQHRVNRGLMYRIFDEIAGPPDEAGCVPAVRGILWARLRITPREVARRFRLAARMRPRRALTGAPLAPELPALARRRGVHLSPQGPDGMSRLTGLLDPAARAYFEALEAAVRSTYRLRCPCPRAPAGAHDCR